MKPLTVTTIQSDLYWENKEANLNMFEEKINAVKERDGGCDITGDVQYGV